MQALDTRTGRSVALKSLANATPSNLARFKHEFRALQGIPQANLVRLEGLFEHEGAWTIAMEHVVGVELLAFVRPEGVLDITRLSAALSGLLRGAQALHEAGFVHRDINPKNVLVTAEGRVVLVDFGLMAPLAARHEDVTDGSLGSAAYVAPEQVDGADFDASADVYAIGSCLYEALTGRVPFEHFTTDRVLDAKRRGRPVPPWALRIEVPPVLEELCLAMLEREPARRPTVVEALALLDRSPGREGVQRVSACPAPPELREERDGPFAGRDNELAKLASAFASATCGGCVVVLIEGEGGVGKTALVSEAVTRLKARAPEVTMLRSRCYANEQTAYQAFDAVVDELARELRKLPRSVCEALLPPKAPLLAQLFPVLASVAAIGEATKKGLPAEPAVRRRDAVAGFVRLLVNLSQRAPLLISIDDLQWADVESFDLLKALLRNADGARLAIVATRRKGEARAPLVEAALDALPGEGAILVTLGRLSPAEAEILVATRPFMRASHERVAAMVREAAGHPLLLRELAAYAESGGELLPPGAFNLEEVLRARFDRLPDDARRLLELVALAARPYGSDVFERTFESPGVFDDALRVLLLQELVRRRGEHEIVCFHDKVRELAAQLIPPERRGKLSSLLAEALHMVPGSDPGDRARLLESAGQLAEAVTAYAEAGSAALDSLAFARADELYQRALDLKGEVPDAERLALLVQRAHALARAGKSAQAAALYTQGAEAAEGEARVRLRVWATQHQIQSAQIEQGMTSARSVLSELDLPLPRGTSGSLARILWERARVAIRGIEVKHARTQVAAKDRLALDAMAGLILPVSWAELLPGAALNMHHLRRSLSVGEPGHVARALSQEAAFRAMQAPDDQESFLPLFQRSRELAVLAGDPAIEAHVVFMEATADTLRSEFSQAGEKLETAHELIVSRAPGEQWLLTSVRMNLGQVRFNTGEHARLVHDAEVWRSDAMDRGDAFAGAALEGLGFGFLAPLMSDTPKVAQERLAQAMEAWPPRSFGFAHHGELIARAHIASYQGTPEAWTWLMERASDHDRAFPHRTRTMSESLAFHRCLAGLGALSAESPSGKAELLVAIDAHRRRVSHSSDGIRGALAKLIAAQVHALGGASELALVALREAKQRFTELGTLPHAHAAACLEGVLEGGEMGQRLRADALAFFAQQGWKDPWRAAAMLVPAARLLARWGK